MFGFICNNFRLLARISSIHELSAHQNPSRFSSLRCRSSSENTTNQRSFVVDYLVNSCGLTSKSALSASKLVNFETPQRPDSVLSLFKDHGFSESQISQLVKRFPVVLTFNPENTILPKFKFFRSQGLSSSDIARLLSGNPLVLGNSLQNGIVPSFNFLRDLIQSDKFLTTFKGGFYVLDHDFETVLAPKINLLRGNGVPESNVLNLVVMARFRKTLRVKFERFKESVEQAIKLGFNPSQSHFILALSALSMTKSRWEQKFNALKRWDLSEEEISAAFRKHPFIMMTSEDKIVAAMGLFVNELGWKSSFIAKSPVLVTYSLEKRLIPRASALQFLLSKGLLKKCLKFAEFFTYSEIKFLHKFINCYDEAPELLKLYGKKLTSSKIEGC